MRLLYVILFAIVVLITACEGPPPTQIVLVVTATQSENIPTQTPYVIVVTATAQDAAASSLTPNATIGITSTQMPAQSQTTPAPVLNAYPTPTFSQIQVAEQVFEGGRMFWLQPSRQIWVMVENGEFAGNWYVFDDTFVDGEMEFDASLAPPEGFLQPVRGFGKVWRDQTQLREALGWAIANEFGYVSGYEYHPGGALNDRGLYEAEPGYHILFSQTNQQIYFDEVTQTWHYVASNLTPMTGTPSPSATP
jgi:hypothetical protein